MQPTNAAFFSLFLEDARLLSFVASHIPRFFERPKKKKEREKMATAHGVDRHFVGRCGRNLDVSLKHLVTQPGNAPKAIPSHLTMAELLTVNKVSLKDSPQGRVL